MGSTLKIKSKEEESLHGQMAKNTMESGLTGISMVLASTTLKKEKSERENGKMVKESDGSMKNENQD